MSMLGGPIAALAPPETAWSTTPAPENCAPFADSPSGSVFRKMRGPGSGEPGPDGLAVCDLGLAEPRDGDARRVGVVADRRAAELAALTGST